MTPLPPSPILSSILAELAHDWLIRMVTGRLTLTGEEASTLAAALRELAISARQMSDTFQRVVAERNELLGMRPAASHADRPEAPAGQLIDLSEFFARERACRQGLPDGGAA